MSESEALEIAVRALRDVLNPVGYFTRNMPADSRINGAAVAIMMQEPSTYKDIAGEALLKLHPLLRAGEKGKE